MSDEWRKQDRPCPPCPDCGTELYERFWGNGGWARTERATDKDHGPGDCVKRLRALLREMVDSDEACSDAIADSKEEDEAQSRYERAWGAVHDLMQADRPR